MEYRVKLLQDRLSYRRSHLEAMEYEWILFLLANPARTRLLLLALFVGEILTLIVIWKSSRVLADMAVAERTLA